MKTTTTTAIEQQSLSFYDSAATAIKQQSLSPDDSVSSPSESSLKVLDDTEFELARIMFDEFAQGLPSDIPMADI
ncbi:hypothetical protein [Chroococcidiopsis sp. CCNUC1]|uniref:hypothetical protein n=1 Tax=Chroococcidiopsis sp. CCNUC1 TaxID=2653189 RepID=UPI002022651F|nr:hypothetical protein [Chroococcidiopsis sp. CCNUC1]URD48082.1 hypothetical protein M5J74_17240 [Chroococcidiopsis sp. CCNUC1]